MQLEITKIFLHIAIFYLDFNVANVKAIIGNNIREPVEKEFPSVVGIKEILGPGLRNEIIICTGTLISRSHVLTTEHCFIDRTNSPLVIVVGSINLRRGKRFNPMWWMTYNQWAEQTKTKLIYKTNDISVIKIPGEAPEDIIPAVISTLPTEQLTGLNVTIAGFGAGNTGVFTSILVVATLKVISRSECNTILTTLAQKNLVVGDNLICTITQPYALLENGDSGGPLFYDNTIIGVNMGNCPKINDEFHPGKANVHVNIILYREFIDYTIQI